MNKKFMIDVILVRQGTSEYMRPRFSHFGTDWDAEIVSLYTVCHYIRVYDKENLLSVNCYG